MKKQQGMVEVESLGDQLPRLGRFVGVIVAGKIVVPGVKAEPGKKEYPGQAPAAERQI